AGNEEGVEYETIRYEGYGPSGVAVIVEALTDNRNRAAANVRNAFTKGGGNMGTLGCVSFMFDEKGLIVIDREEVEMDEEELMMVALDAGAEDFSAEDDSFEITTLPEDFSAVREALEKAEISMLSAEVTMIPQTHTELKTAEDLKKMNKLLDLLDEDDDVQNVYHNWWSI
ncbi:MAG: YebC/PmpR family DNA-binding transcriptional regulator, partial [Anaerotignum sp.]